MKKKSSTKNIKRAKVISSRLEIKGWKTEVPDEQRRLFIAKSLNHCVYDESLEIIGYLITSFNVYLLIQIKKLSYDQIMKHFEELMIIEINNYLHVPNDDKVIYGESYVFEKHNLYDENLKKMITGRKAEIDHYTPQLRRLQKTIKYNMFCSALDYSGGTSAVIIKEKSIKL